MFLHFKVITKKSKKKKVSQEKIFSIFFSFHFFFVLRFILILTVLGFNRITVCKIGLKCAFKIIISFPFLTNENAKNVEALFYYLKEAKVGVV